MKIYRKLILLITILFNVFYASAQQKNQKYTISGFLSDSLTTENLIGASVYHGAGKAGTTTNQFGFYSLTLPAGKADVFYSYVGYTPKKMTFFLQQDTSINISLNNSLELNEVEITATRTLENTQMSSFTVPVATIEALPALVGETDLMKVLQLLPGIQSGNEGSSGLYVRGGGPDQNLILLDGVPVYNAAHLFGFFSVFNTDAINNVEVFKGGFPARYGGRISSVVDISMKEGNAQKFKAEGAIGLLAGKFTFEGPIWKNRTSFIVSGRRTYINWLAKPFTDLGYHFYDLNAKINHKFSEKDRIYLSAYLGNDYYLTRSESEPVFYMSDYYYSNSENMLRWGNITSAFRWNHKFSHKLFANTAITYSRFLFRTGSGQWSTKEPYEGRVSETTSNGIYYQSGIRDWSGKISFDYLPSYRHHVRFGSGVTFHRFSPGVTTMGENVKEIRNDAIQAPEFDSYIEDDILLSYRLKINAGIHWSGFNVRHKFYQSFQPRVSVRYLAGENMSVKAAYSRMVQYVQLLTNANVGLPTDLWVPATDLLAPQISDQVALGVIRDFGGIYELDMEGYYKTMNHVLEYKEGISFYETDVNWEYKVDQGIGRSYGVELFARKKKGSLIGWIGYTLSWSQRRFDRINNGEWFSYKYDRRHDISIVATHRFGKKIEVSGTWVFGSGNCMTIPLGYTEVQNPSAANQPSMRGSVIALVYGERNGYRMDPYHRLDLSISFIKKKSWGEARWVIGIYNIYNRRNPYFIDVKNNYPEMELRYFQTSLFSIMPAISYQFKF